MWGLSNSLLTLSPKYAINNIPHFFGNFAYRWQPKGAETCFRLLKKFKSVWTRQPRILLEHSIVQTSRIYRPVLNVFPCLSFLFKILKKLWLHLQLGRKGKLCTTAHIQRTDSYQWIVRRKYNILNIPYNNMWKSWSCRWIRNMFAGFIYLLVIV